MHARRYFFKALESDPQHRGPALHLIARVYAVEDRAKGLTAEERLALRQRLSAPLLEKLHKYLLELREQVLPKSPSGAAVRYALNQWEALTPPIDPNTLPKAGGTSPRPPVVLARTQQTRTIESFQGFFTAMGRGREPLDRADEAYFCSGGPPCITSARRTYW